MSIERVERALAAALEEEQREAARIRRYPRTVFEDTTQRGQRDVLARNLLPRFIDVVRAAKDCIAADVSMARNEPRAEHRWDVSFGDLGMALAALDTAIQEELPKEESHDQ